MKELVERYIKASELFNQYNKNKYRIDVFLDFSFLNIIVRDLKNNTYKKCSILNDKISDLSIDEIVKAYNELLEEIE